MTTKLTQLELTELLDEAQEQMRSALENLQRYARETGDEHAQRYIIPSLEVLIGRDHYYLDRSENVDDLKARLTQSYGSDLAGFEGWFERHYQDHVGSLGMLDLDELIDAASDAFGLEPNDEGELWLGDSDLCYHAEQLAEQLSLDTGIRYY